MDSGLSPRKQIRSVFELNRRKEDDSGFYHVVCRQEKNLLVAIYEGGVVGFSEEGDVLWNREKSWDELFVKSENGVLDFESEFSEASGSTPTPGACTVAQRVELAATIVSRVGA